MEIQLEKESLRAPVGAGAGLSPAELSRQRQLASLRQDLGELKKQIDQKTVEEKRLRTLAGTYQMKVDRMPVRDAELTEITREYGVQEKIYNDLVAGREQANMSMKVEQRQIGEQYRLIEPARRPEKPYKPNRLMINLFGLLGGLGLGLALVALLEYQDGTFKTDTELAGITHLPVLAVVPMMESAGERRAAFRRRMIFNVAFGGVAAVCLAVVAYSFVFIR